MLPKTKCLRMYQMFRKNVFYNSYNDVYISVCTIVPNTLLNSVYKMCTISRKEFTNSNECMRFKIKSLASTLSCLVDHF